MLDLFAQRFYAAEGVFGLDRNEALSMILLRI